MIVYLNGRFVSDEKAVVSIFDHGFLYGDGAYETIRVYRGKPFLLREHLSRLNQSLLGLHLLPPVSLVDIGNAVRETVSQNRHRDAAVRIIITRGPGPFGFDPRLCSTPTVLIVSGAVDCGSLDRLRRGITAAVVSIRRNPPSSLPPWIKSISCLNGILAKIEANELGAREGILLTHGNWVAEGTVSNVFAVKRGRLRTPPTDESILPGVTRDWVLRLAREADIPVEEDRISVPDLVSADEVFLTSTIMEIAPVTRLIFNITLRPREVRVGSGKPGETTRRLLRAFRESVSH